MMDLQEATRCLDERRVALANLCGMLKPNVAQGKFGEAMGKLNQKLIEKLNDEEKDAAILSIIISEETKERHEQLLDYPGELADLFVALNQLKLGIDTAAEARAEYLRQAAAATKEKESGSELSRVLEKFMRENNLMSKEEIEEYDRDMGQESPPDLVETSNAPDRIEICVAAETDAADNEGGTEIGSEPSDSAGTRIETDGGSCGSRSP
jgi:hypothetical protein